MGVLKFDSFTNQVIRQFVNLLNAVAAGVDRPKTFVAEFRERIATNAGKTDDRRAFLLCGLNSCDDVRRGA